MVIAWRAWDDKAHMFAYTSAAPQLQLGARSVPCRVNVTPCGPNDGDLERFASAVDAGDESAYLDDDTPP
ncbi:hypothetical protein BH09MYX1_BH09MYX1_35930 [soil metagenome]